MCGAPRQPRAATARVGGAPRAETRHNRRPPRREEPAAERSRDASAGSARRGALGLPRHLLPVLPVARRSGRSRRSGRARAARCRLYLVFTGIAVLGNYLGIPVLHGEAIVNTRAVGATLAGLLGGPLLGFLVGATAGLHRVTALSGVSSVPGRRGDDARGAPRRARSRRAAAQAGAAHDARGSRSRRRSSARLSTWRSSYFLTRPFPDRGAEVVRIIALPMILANPVGAALFMAVLNERQREHDCVAAASSARRAQGWRSGRSGSWRAGFGPRGGEGAGDDRQGGDRASARSA